MSKKDKVKTYWHIPDPRRFRGMQYKPSDIAHCVYATEYKIPSWIIEVLEDEQDEEDNSL